MVHYKLDYVFGLNYHPFPIIRLTYSIFKSYSLNTILYFYTIPCKYTFILLLIQTVSMQNIKTHVKDIQVSGDFMPVLQSISYS